jgi:uncharacterized protein (DUF3084 family)
VREIEIEGRDREIDGRNRKIEGRDREIDGRNKKIEGRDREIDGRNRKIEGRDKETEKQRDTADNKNPKQSWVAQLVLNKTCLFLMCHKVPAYALNKIYDLVTKK